MPKHEFVVENRIATNDSSFISFSWNSNGEIYREGLLEEDHLSIDDELVQYISDSLNWLPSWNPSTNKSSNGLNIHGVTILDQQSLLTFRRIIQAWTDLFGLAPEKIMLTGSYYTIECDAQIGQYERLEYNKADLIKKLNKLIDMTDKALTNDKCILHLGI